MSFVKTAATAVAAAAIAATGAFADGHATTNLRIQTHYTPENNSGKLIQKFVDNVQTMSNGEINIEMFWSSSVVKSVEGFDAAATGILDCEMHGGGYQTGKNPAFQFVGDIMGGYDTPYQQLSWLYYAGGLEAAQELYNQFGMQLVGWWIYGQESFASTRPIASTEDLKGWKFRSPPGMETMIFERLGASPIVMDFTEIFTALETGIIDGADAANLTNNIGLGLYDIAEHTNYPGFHSMPADHLACNKSVWDAMPAHHQAILKVGMQALGLKNTTINEVKNAENSVALAEKGLNMYQWSEEDMAVYRQAVQDSWKEFATTPESQNLLNAHLDFLRGIGAMQ